MAFNRTEHGLHQKDIGGHSYEFMKWGAEEALDALLDLSAVIGKPLGALAPHMDLAAAQERRLEIAAEAIGPALEALATQLGSNKPLCKALLKRLATKGILCDGREIVFDAHYKDRLPHMLDVALAALEVQFGGFFAGASAAFRVRPPAGTRPGSEPPTSTDSSGDPSSRGSAPSGR